ncbi:MAG: DUF2860 domain-containing protein [Desulforhopalus sp.]|nr:DUF2860 domain-containing protein [Desulforhopalus sp.]
MKKLYLAVSILPLFYCVTPVVAAETKASGFSGNIGMGLFMVNTADNLDPKGSEKRLTDLNGAADMETEVMPFVLPSMTYTFDGGTRVFFKGDPGNEEFGGFALSLGAALPVATLGIFEAAAIYSPFERAWQNPYALGVGRDSTSVAKVGAKIGFTAILGSPLGLSAVYMNDDTEDDLLAGLFPDLARDGEVFGITCGYTFLRAKTFDLRGELSYLSGNYEGDSNSFQKGRMTVQGRYTIDRLSFLPKITYSYTEYDKEDPVFAKTRETNGYGGTMMISYAAPFGLEGWAAQGLVGYSRGDGSITFYDTEKLTTGLFMTYRF